MIPPATILGIAEDPRRAAVLRSALVADGHRVVILDEPGAPDPEFDLLVARRQATSAPIIVLSGDDNETTKVSALDRGADESGQKKTTSDFMSPTCASKLKKICADRDIS